jgi:PAS domain S-box-containing protein
VGIVPVRLLDPTPYAFVLTGLAWAWGLFRHRLLTIVPIARDTVIESMRDGVLVLDLHHRIVDVNPALTRIIDRDPSDVVGRTYEEVFRPWPDLADLLQAGLKDVQEINTVAGDLRRHIELQVSGLRNRRSRLVGRLIVVRDITRRKQVEEARRESEARYRAIVEQQTDLVCRFGPDGTPTFVNEAYCRYFGKERDEILSGGFEPMIYEEDLPEAQEYLEGLGLNLPTGTLEHRVQVDGGKVRWLQWRNRAIYDNEGRIVEFQGVGRDVTKRRQMEEQLREYTVHLEQLVAEKVRELDLERAKTIQTAKLASLGEMATGVAHELNQPLTSILFDIDYLRTMAQRAPDRSPLDLTALRQVTDDMANDVARCRRIIDHLRAFGRSFDAYDTSVVLNQPIEDSFILVGERLRQNLVEVTLDLAADLPPVLASPHQLEQVFLNLISNAEHAMEQMACRVEQGEVTCSSYQKNLRIVTYAEDDCVVAEVSDNGCGIPEDYWERIFEPFFTTKPVGEGTGLGLSISFGIVRKFGGEITFESEENKGTTFTLRFPVAAERGRAD